VQAARLATGYRQAFGTDVFIDLVCYRRHGHNELDDPSITQPVLYERIRKHPSVVERYAERLAREGVLEAGALEMLRRQRRTAIESALTAVRREANRTTRVLAFGGVWKGFGPAGDDRAADTRVDADRVRAIVDGLVRVPDGFHPHTRVAKVFQERHARVERGEGLDWGTVELIAYGSLLLEGTPVRLCGQDTGMPRSSTSRTAIRTFRSTTSPRARPSWKR